MATTLVQNMACSKAMVMQAGVSLPKPRCTSVMRGASTSRMWGASTNCMWGDLLTKTCVVSGQREDSQVKGVRVVIANGDVKTKVESNGGIREKLNKVVLAYSGGLDTLVIVPWLRKNYGSEVVCFTVDVGQAMVDVAKACSIDAMLHGCIGKAVVAPWREWDIKGQEDAIEYAKKQNIPVTATKKSIYSWDHNLWHISHEGDILEDSTNEPVKDMFVMSVDLEDALDTPEYVKIQIEKGLPVGYNSNKLSPATLLVELNKIGGKHDIGRIDMVENRLVGMKSRRVYETSGGTILASTYRELEAFTLDRESMQMKDMLTLKYVELVYAGCSPV